MHCLGSGRQQAISLVTEWEQVVDIAEREYWPNVQVLHCGRCLGSVRAGSVMLRVQARVCLAAFNFVGRVLICCSARQSNCLTYRV